MGITLLASSGRPIDFMAPSNAQALVDADRAQWVHWPRNLPNRIHGTIRSVMPDATEITPPDAVLLLDPSGQPYGRISPDNASLLLEHPEKIQRGIISPAQPVGSADPPHCILLTEWSHTLDLEDLLWARGTDAADDVIRLRRDYALLDKLLGDATTAADLTKAQIRSLLRYSQEAMGLDPNESAQSVWELLRYAQSLNEAVVSSWGQTHKDALPLLYAHLLMDCDMDTAENLATCTIFEPDMRYQPPRAMPVLAVSEAIARTLVRRPWQSWGSWSPSIGAAVPMETEHRKLKSLAVAHPLGPEIIREILQAQYPNRPTIALVAAQRPDLAAMTRKQAKSILSHYNPDLMVLWRLRKQMATMDASSTPPEPKHEGASEDLAAVKVGHGGSHASLHDRRAFSAVNGQ